MAGSTKPRKASAASKAKAAAAAKTKTKSKKNQGAGDAQPKKRKAEDVIAEQEAKIQKLEEKNAAREAQLSSLHRKQLMKSIARRSKIARALIVNMAMKKLLVDSVKPILWRLCKFLVDEKDGAEAIKIILLPTDEWPKYVGLPEWEQLEICQTLWELYGDDICKVLNGCRTNTLNGVRKAYQLALYKGEAPPDPDQLLELVCRRGLKYDPEHPEINAENRSWLRWYWNDVLPKVAGKDNWNTNIRHYHTPTTAFIPGMVPRAKFIPAGTEAFVVLAVENSYTRWVLEVELKNQGKSAKDIDEENVPRHKTDWPTKYTDQRAGKAVFGGWTTEARNRFEFLEHKIKKDRSKTWAKAAEFQALEDIQIEKKIKAKLDDREKGKKVVAKTEAELEDARVAFGQETDDDATGVSDDEEEEEEAEQEVVGEVVDQIPVAAAAKPVAEPENQEPPPNESDQDVDEDSDKGDDDEDE
jgi:hypothetical protein